MTLGTFKNILGLLLTIIPLAFFIPFEKSIVISAEKQIPESILEVKGSDYNIKNLREILLGQNSVLYFGYLNCKTVCSGSIGILKKILLSQPENNRLQLVFVTLDPERDRPEHLAKILQVEPTRFHLFSPENSLSAFSIAKEFGTPANKANSSEIEFNHRDAAFLINSNAKILGIIPELKSHWDRNPKLVSRSIIEIFN
ncbi:SCO family protein [Leptospira wolffii]|uniref:SCO family protein n=1 Tax=Leptospira wolffii TaxID=409998 RepID=UPI00035396B8|nr:SCO1/SenC [Leptospira wolffii serovar Khorat str. Khorat-H2]